MSDDNKEIYDSGFDDGYTAAEIRTIKEYEEQIANLKSDHECALERSYEEGYTECEQMYDRKLSHIQYNIQCMIDDFKSIIKDLRKQNYDLRKKNAATTRIVQKSI